MIEPSVRAGNAEALLGVLQSLGLDVPKLLRTAALSPEDWRNPETQLSLYMIDRLLSEAEAETGCDHVGLLVGRQVADLGLPTFIFFNAPDLQTGLQDLVDFFPLMNNGGTLELDQTAETATLRYANVVPMLRCAHQVSDCVLAQAQGVMSRYCGKKVRATEVRFSRRPPRDLAPYLEHFGRAKLTFNSEDAAFEFPSSLLLRKSPDADPALYRFLRERESRTQSTQMTLAQQVERMVRFMIVKEPFVVAEVAGRLRMSRPTLNRRLRQEGTSVQALVSAARHEAALQLLENTDLPVGVIAHAIGHSDAASFSRAFTGRAGESPSSFRKKWSGQKGAHPSDPTG